MSFSVLLADWAQLGCLAQGSLPARGAGWASLSFHVPLQVASLGFLPAWWSMDSQTPYMVSGFPSSGSFKSTMTTYFKGIVFLFF